MAIYNVNQNRQFYVVKEVVEKTPTKEGEIMLGKTKDGKQIFFKHYGKGGLSRTDIIDGDKICYAKVTTKEEMQRKLKKAVITLSEDVNGGLPISGQDYILRVQINNYLAPGDANVLIKSSAVHATKDMTAEKFYEKMVKSLEMNFSREKAAGLTEMLKFEASEDGITITELGNQPWRLGVLSQEAVNFEVIPTEVTFDGEDCFWGEVEYSETEETVGNGTQVADLEYFCQAERGDMFRNMGWPNNIDVKYMVDPSKEYDMLDVHYYYSGDGVQVHKSEKDITFVSAEKGVIAEIAKAFSVYCSDLSQPANPGIGTEPGLGDEF